jgi:hypothetical protein
MSRRSVSRQDLVGRSYWGDDDDYLGIGDKPWYCFWNSTISEFWIFLDQNVADTDPTDPSSTITSATNDATSTPLNAMSYDSGPLYGSQSTTPNPANTTPPPSNPTDEAYWTGPSRKSKRQASAGSPYFPKLAKMVEKRKPDDNVQPYCQQMQVLNNWQIVAIPDIPTICITESDYQASATGGSRMAARKRDPDTVSQLASNCICEWFSV